MDKWLHPLKVTTVKRKEGKLMKALHVALAVWWQFVHRSRSETDERGLSQSTENAILLAGAVTVAVLIVTVITAYVQSRLPS